MDRTQSVELEKDVVVNLGANWLAGEFNPLRRYINIRNLEAEDRELDIKVLDKNFEDITEQYLPLAEEYIMGKKIWSLNFRLI